MNDELHELFGPALRRLAYEEHGGEYAPTPRRQIGAEPVLPRSHNAPEWRSVREDLNRRWCGTRKNPNRDPTAPIEPYADPPKRPERTAYQRRVPYRTDHSGIAHPPGTTVYALPLGPAEIRAFIPDGLVSIHGSGDVGWLYAVVRNDITIITPG